MSAASNTILHTLRYDSVPSCFSSYYSHFPFSVNFRQCCLLPCPPTLPLFRFLWHFPITLLLASSSTHYLWANSSTNMNSMTISRVILVRFTLPVCSNQCVSQPLCFYLLGIYSPWLKWIIPHGKSMIVFLNFFVSWAFNLASLLLELLFCPFHPDLFFFFK